MYGKEVYVDGIRVFVFGVPEMTKSQWEAKARRMLKARLEAPDAKA